MLSKSMLYLDRPATLRCAIYARVSKGDQEAENQLNQLRTFAKDSHWIITEVYTDEESGRKDARAGFQRMLTAASRRQFDVVLFWSLDRFSRQGALETLNYLRQLTSYGVMFRSFTQQYLDSCGIFRDAIISILAVVAKQEAITISERTKAGLERARQRGAIIGRARFQLDEARFRARAIEAGDSLTKLCAEFGCSRMTASRLRQRYRAESPGAAPLHKPASCPHESPRQLAMRQAHEANAARVRRTR